MPITFFLQFTKVINCFYLINMILQSIPQVSTNTWYFSVIPLAGLIMFGMVLEAVNEIKRWSEDKKTNAQPSYKVKCGKTATLEHISELRSDMVEVGDIIVVKDDETVPADCLLISTDPSKQNMGGQCFISTAQLDGERNLKPKMAILSAERCLIKIITGECSLSVDIKNTNTIDINDFKMAKLKLVQGAR